MNDHITNEMSDDVYRIIVENLGEEIFVCNGKGEILFVNPASIEINEIDAKDSIGKNVKQLIDEGYFSESTTLQVLKKKKPVSIIQTLKSGKKIIATGIPIFDDDGNISLVISTSEDVEAVNELLETLEEQEQVIESLQEELSKNSEYMFVDPISIKLQNTLDKISSLDFPVLIMGESGTGKQIAARYIHFSSGRKDKKFISVNCTSTDDGFLEKEIFGEEEISETGEITFIKRGKLDYADEGTLLLNNITYMPLKVQAKLFEFIDTGEFVRVGGNSNVNSKARIIATTGTNLKEMCNNGMFNKALYYSLNTVPVRMPALRERSKDIPSLAKTYMDQCNEKYKSKKILSNNALGVLESHTWPGNLIELNQAIESAYILTDGPMISGKTLYEIIYDSAPEDNTAKVICTDIIPLKEAKRQVEEQLVKNAMEVYKTTYRAAEVLEVNQSTVSRIVAKLFK